MDFDNVTLTSQKPCQNYNKFDCSKQTVATFHSKRRKKDILWKKNFICPADKTFWIIRIINFNRAEPTCYKFNFHCTIFGKQNGAFGT